jgi:hypothetical protein
MFAVFYNQKMIISLNSTFVGSFEPEKCTRISWDLLRGSRRGGENSRGDEFCLLALHRYLQGTSNARMANPNRIHINALRKTSRLRTIICSSRRRFISSIIFFSPFFVYSSKRQCLNWTLKPNNPFCSCSIRTAQRAATFNAATGKAKRDPIRIG